MSAEITVVEDGPYGVQGPARILDGEEREVKVLEEGELAFLCRCGSSKTKPFCDGTHEEIGFSASA